jgi:hypothetical protein
MIRWSKPKWLYAVWSRKVRRVLYLITTLVLTILLVRIVQRRHEVVWVRVPIGVLPWNIHLLILNPSRTWQAKRAADALLECLSAGDAKCAIDKFPMLDKRSVEDHAQVPPAYWTLDNVREESNGNLILFYPNTTGDDPNMGGYFLIYCSRNLRGIWTVYDFRRVY